MKKAQIFPVQKNDFESIKRISDACFGNNYLTTSQLDEMLNNEGFCFKIELNKQTIGFCIAQLINTDNKKLEFEVYDTPERKIAIIKTLAVHPTFQRKGFGTQLLQHAIKKINSLTSSLPIYYPAWLESKSDGFCKSVKNEGFMEFQLYQNFWLKDSLQHNYNCIRCGNPPCRCSMLLYRKS